MSFSNSRIIPAAFWVGFLALGFATNLGGPSKTQPVKSSLIAETDATHGSAPRSAQD